MNSPKGLILTCLMCLVFVAPLSGQREPSDDKFTTLAGVHLEDGRSNADVALARASYETALGLVRDGIAEEGGNPKLYFFAGIALLGLDQYVEADQMFDRAEEIYPDYFLQTDGTELYREHGWIQAYNAGLELLEGGDNTGAIESFANANLVYDRRPEGFLNLANTYFNVGDLTSAREQFEIVVSTVQRAEEEGHHPDDIEIWIGYKQTSRINIARILTSEDRQEEAVVVLQAVLAEDPDNGAARNILAVAMAQTGQGGDAVGIYTEIIDSPESSLLDIYNAGVGLYGGENYMMAVRAFSVALDKSPMFRDALQSLTQALSQAASDDETLWEQMPEYTTRLLEMDPHNELAYQLHGIALARGGDTEAAIAFSDRMEALPFNVQQLQLRPGIGVVGALLNKTLEQGAEVTLRFTFYDTTGQDLGTVDHAVPAPAQGEGASFQVQFDDAATAGYTYEVVSS